MAGRQEPQAEKLRFCQSKISHAQSGGTGPSAGPRASSTFDPTAMASPSPPAEAVPKQGSVEQEENAEGSSGNESGQAGDMDSRASLQARFAALQKRRTQSQRANLKSLQESTQQTRQTARDEQRLARQRKLVEELRLKAEASDPEDVERAKNWSYSIEENDEWEKKLRRKRRRAEYEFNGEWLMI